MASFPVGSCISASAPLLLHACRSAHATIRLGMSLKTHPLELPLVGAFAYGRDGGGG
jgi:hypothetical protein